MRIYPSRTEVDRELMVTTPDGGSATFTVITTGDGHEVTSSIDHAFEVREVTSHRSS